MKPLFLIGVASLAVTFGHQVISSAKHKEYARDGHGFLANQNDHEASLAMVVLKGTEFDEPVSEVRKQAHATYNKARSMQPDRMIKNDLKTLARYLMPGKLPDIRKKAIEISLVIIAILWLVPFTWFLYANDESGDLDRWKEVERKAYKEEPGVCSIEPDLVLVFHHPLDEDAANRAEEVPLASLEKSIRAEHGVLQHMDRFTQQWKSTPRMMNRVTGIFKGRDAGGKDAEQESEHVEQDQSFGAVRQALLQDLYNHLAHAGFAVTIFASVDKDELFVCVSLDDEQVIDHHLSRNGMKLQIKEEVVQALGIKQPPDEVESSPPHLSYDSRLSTNVLGEASADADFYKTYTVRGNDKTIISSAQRIRICMTALNSLINLDFAVKQGLLVDWFPAHTPSKLGDLEACWGSWALLKDLSCVQPLPLLEEYFGSRVAFLFAWNGLYCKAMLALLPIAIVFEIANAISILVGKTEHWNRGSVLGFSLVVVVWSKFAANLWYRQQEYFIAFFDLNQNAADKKDRAVRPDFHGEEQPSPIDQNQTHLVYPAWKHELRKTGTWTITLIFCSFVFLTVVLWLDLFHGRLDKAASIVLAIIIQIFTQIYNYMAEALTIAENHKFQETFYNSYLMKMFIFQFVNQYSAFLYIAVKQQFTIEGCPGNNDCVGLLKAQLPTTLLVLSFTRVVQVIVAAVQVELSLWYEDYKLKKAGEDASVRSFVEKQGKFGPFRVREQIEVTVQLALTLGYVLIFGAVAPRIVPLCFMVFVVQLRAGAVLLTRSAHRPIPRKALGVGRLQEIVSLLMICGMTFTGYLLVNYGPMFRGTTILTKVTGLILWIGTAAVLWQLVEIAYPRDSSSKDVLLARRDHVWAKVIQKNSDVLFSKMGKKFRSASKPPVRGQDEAPKTNVPFATEVASGSWSAIPRLADTASADK